MFGKFEKLVHIVKCVNQFVDLFISEMLSLFTFIYLLFLKASESYKGYREYRIKSHVI